MYSPNHSLTQAITKCFHPNKLLKEKVGKIPHSTPWPAPSGLAEGVDL